jgi:hypothetical protein
MGSKLKTTVEILAVTYWINWRGDRFIEPKQNYRDVRQVSRAKSFTLVISYSGDLQQKGLSVLRICFQRAGHRPTVLL